MMTIFKRIVSLILICACVFSQTACSLFSPSQELISVSTSETDAEIFINGQFAGRGVASMQVPRDQAASVMAKKVGYAPVSETVPVRFSTTGIIDMIGGCTWLIPFVGATSPGFWQHEYTNVSMPMVRE